MGLNRLLHAAALFLAVAPLPAFADEADDCETLGAEQIAQESSAARSFEIDREALYLDRAETFVGAEFVSSVLHGPAKLGGAAEGETERVRFVCLHGGTGKGALFFWLLPN